MYLNNISLLNFRNYEKSELHFKPGISLITGENGQGKSNFLEAVYCLCFGKSFRPAHDADMVNWNRSYYYLQGIICSDNCRFHVEAGYEKTQRRKVIKLNGVKEKKGIMHRAFPVVFFVPEDLDIVRRGPEERRRFMDRELSQSSTAYAADLSAYNRALMQKNRLLKEKLSSTAINPLLQPWDRQLVLHGSRIVYQRIAALQSWSKLAAINYLTIFHGLQKLEILYMSSICTADNLDYQHCSLQEIGENMSRQIKLRSGEERSRGHALVGPHKDDMLFLIDRREARKFASHGQQRSAVIALKAAQVRHYAETVEKPLFIIDDIFSELDEQRRRQCMLLYQNAAQVFLTAADGSNLSAYHHGDAEIVSYYTVEQGKIRETSRGD